MRAMRSRAWRRRRRLAASRVWARSGRVSRQRPHQPSSALASRTAHLGHIGFGSGPSKRSKFVSKSPHARLPRVGEDDASPYPSGLSADDGPPVALEALGASSANASGSGEGRAISIVTRARGEIQIGQPGAGQPVFGHRWHFLPLWNPRSPWGRTVGGVTRGLEVALVTLRARHGVGGVAVRAMGASFCVSVPRGVAEVPPPPGVARY